MTERTPALFVKEKAMLEVKAERCAGIDVGKKFLAVCVMIGPANEKPVVEVRRFGTNVKDLEKLRAWLQQTGCSEAVMESTGSYWKPVFNILEGSLKIILANPEQVKALRGKKTDPNDSRWLASLLRHGLVQGSFIPSRDIRELRDLTRRRRVLLSDGTAERNRVQKVLEDANIKLGNVLSDVFGTSGQLMLGSVIREQANADRDRGTGAKPITAKDSTNCGIFGRPPADRSSPSADQAVASSYGVHRTDDRRIGYGNRTATPAISKANRVGMYGAGHRARRRCQHLGGNGNGYD